MASKASSSSSESVVGFIDMDCFCESSPPELPNLGTLMSTSAPLPRLALGFVDVAVEANGPFASEVKGKPAAVVQYNSSQVGGTPDCAPDDRYE